MVSAKSAAALLDEFVSRTATGVLNVCFRASESAPQIAASSRPPPQTRTFAVTALRRTADIQLIGSGGHLQAPISIAQEPNGKILVVDMIGDKQAHTQPVSTYVVRGVVGYKPVLHSYLQSNQTQPQSAAPTRYKSQVSDTA